jgi:tetratricopeptide (TPR) repeat protein
MRSRTTPHLARRALCAALVLLCAVAAAVAATGDASPVSPHWRANDSDAALTDLRFDTDCNTVEACSAAMAACPSGDAMCELTAKIALARLEYANKWPHDLVDASTPRVIDSETDTVPLAAAPSEADYDAFFQGPVFAALDTKWDHLPSMAALSPGMPLYAGDSVLENVFSREGGVVASRAQYHRQLRAVGHSATVAWAFFLGLGNTWRASGNAWRAVQCFRKALTLDPLSTNTWSNLANVLFLVGHTDDALTILEDTMHRAEKRDAHFQMLTYGDMLLQSGRFKEALTMFQSLLDKASAVGESDELAELQARIPQITKLANGDEAALTAWDATAAAEGKHTSDVLNQPGGWTDKSGTTVGDEGSSSLDPRLATVWRALCYAIAICVVYVVVDYAYDATVVWLNTEVYDSEDEDGVIFANDDDDDAIFDDEVGGGRGGTGNGAAATTAAAATSKRVPKGGSGGQARPGKHKAKGNKKRR